MTVGQWHSRLDVAGEYRLRSTVKKGSPQQQSGWHVVAAWEGELDREKMAPIALKRGRHARAAETAAQAKVATE